MARERILVTVKTYPVLSLKYTELACTAGLRTDGTWIRLYPIQFRLLDSIHRYKKYQWIEVDTVKNDSDLRPESYRVVNIEEMRLLEAISSRNWEERRRAVLKNTMIYTNRDQLVQLAHQNKVSLAIFKPTKIVSFNIEDVDPNVHEDKIDTILSKQKQRDLFGDQSTEDFKLMPPLPVKFSYSFIDDAGCESTLMIEDWEVCQLYWNCVKKDGPEIAKEKVKAKYMDDLACTKDLYFFLGTTYEWHFRKSRNPFIIVGTFHPPFEIQPSLF